MQKLFHGNIDEHFQDFLDDECMFVYLPCCKYNQWSLKTYKITKHSVANSSLNSWLSFEKIPLRTYFIDWWVLSMLFEDYLQYAFRAALCLSLIHHCFPQWTHALSLSQLRLQGGFTFISDLLNVVTLSHINVYIMKDILLKIAINFRPCNKSLCNKYKLKTPVSILCNNCQTVILIAKP